jgi:hypothetical protein
MPNRIRRSGRYLSNRRCSDLLLLLSAFGFTVGVGLVLGHLISL